MYLAIVLKETKLIPVHNQMKQNIIITTIPTLSTTYLALSASCWATCFISTASVNSRPNVKCVYKNILRQKCIVCYIFVPHTLWSKFGIHIHCTIFKTHLFVLKHWHVILTMEISSSIRPKVAHRWPRNWLILCDTNSLCVISSLASNSAWKHFNFFLKVRR